MAFIRMVEKHALGTTRPSLNTGLLESFNFLMPPIELQDRFAHLVAAFDSLRMSHDSQSRSLAAIRDFLLPKLLSGEIKVYDGELK